MEKKWILALIVLGVLLSANLVHSAPAPYQLALNHETKECGLFWAGDEYIFYELSSDWKAYYINYTSGFVETEIGNCNINPRSNTNEFEECCKQLGYNFVEGNIGIKERENYSLIFLNIIFSPFGIIVLLFIIIVIAFIIYHFKLKGRKK